MTEKKTSLITSASLEHLTQLRRILSQGGQDLQQAQEIVAELTDVVVHEASERKTLEAFREALLTLGAELNSTREPVEAARALIGAADKLWSWDAATVDLLRFEDGIVEAILVLDTVDGQRREFPQLRQSRETPLMRQVLREGATLILRQPEAKVDSGWIPFGDTNRRSASIMCVPIRRESKTIGLFSLQSYSYQAYTHQDLQTLQALADYCGGALERIRSEDALLRSQERYRDLVETTFDWVWEVDADGRYIYSSPKVQEVLGYSVEEVLGKTPFDFMPDGEAQRVREVVRGRISRREPLVCIENTNVRKDGRAVVLETSGVPIIGPDGVLKGYRGMDRDITERKRTEHLTRIQHSLASQLATESGLQRGLQLCLEAAIEAGQLDSGAVYLRRENNGALDLKAHKGLSSTFISQVAYFGPDTAQAELVSLGQPYYTSKPDLGVQSTATFAAEGLRFVAMTPFKHAGRIIGCMALSSHTADDLPAILREVVETIAAGAGHAIARLEMEEALRRSQADLLEAQKVARVGNWSCDFDNGLLRWSDELYRIFRIERDEFDGTQGSFLSRVHPADRHKVWEASHLAQCNKTPFNIEYRVVTHDGSVKTLREHGHPRLDSEGKVVGL